VLIDLNLMESPWAYSVMAVTILIDTYLLYVFFTVRSARIPRVRKHIVEIIRIVSDSTGAFNEDVPSRNYEVARLGDGGISAQPNSRYGVLASRSAHDEGHSWRPFQSPRVSKFRASYCMIG
jgi:hypothetical protein